MWTMWTVIRDLTVDKDINLNLPMKEAELDNVLNPEHEYIFVDWNGPLKLTEYSNINEVNEFLLYCKEKSIDEITIEILSECAFERFCNETDKESFIKKLENYDYEIIDFDEVTKDWSCASIYDDRDKGLALFIEGMNLPFNITRELAIEMEDWIRWENLWNESESDGWKVITIGSDLHSYLVRV